jgi:hypothetical protein
MNALIFLTSILIGIIFGVIVFSGQRRERRINKEMRKWRIKKLKEIIKEQANEKTL